MQGVRTSCHIIMQDLVPMHVSTISVYPVQVHQTLRPLIFPVMTLFNFLDKKRGINNIARLKIIANKLDIYHYQ